MRDTLVNPVNLMYFPQFTTIYLYTLKKKLNENQFNLQSRLKTVESYESLSQTLPFHEDILIGVVCVGRKVQL